MTRTVVIGLDGATFEVVDEHRDRLPTLDRMMETGTHAVLESTKPPITSVAWPGFSTGRNPGRYGIFDFMSRDPATMEFFLNDVRKKRTDFFWQYMDEPMGMASVPVIPYHSIDGFFVQEDLARINQHRITKPPELQGRIPDVYEYSIDFDAESTDDVVDNVMERIDAREELFVDLVSDTDLPLYFLMFSIVDQVQHHFWAHYDESHPAHRPTDYREVIPGVYERLDAAVERIVASFDEDVNVVLVSDHGFGPRRWDVNVNALLSDAGFLEYSSDTKTRFGRLARTGKELVSRTPLYSLVPDALKSAASQHMPEQEDFGDAVEWDETVAYSFGASGHVYINRQDRETRGVVSPGEYDTVREEVASVLRDASNDAAGEAPVASVEYAEDVYEGRYAEYGPDLVVNYAPGYHVSTNLGRAVYSRYDDLVANTGHHEPEGIFVASGPDFRDTGRDTPLSILDVAPTLLHLYGYPVPEEMDGRVATDRLADPGTVQYTDGSKPERRRVADRVLTLKQLDRI